MEFGDVFTIRLLTARPTVVAAAPESVEELLKADPETAHAGEARRTVLPFASPRSVFGGDGAAHDEAEAHMAPALSRAAVDARREEMEAIATRHAEALPRGGVPIRLLERVRGVTDEIFVRVVLGVRDEELVARLIASIRHMLRTPGNPPVTLPGPGDGLVGALGQKLFERRQAPALAALSEAVGDEARAEELMSLVMAAQEPPAIALTWVLDRLGREPELAEAYLAAPDGEAADAVVKETLRLNPPASAALRKLTAPRRVGGFDLPAGVDVMVPSTLVHRDPRGFEDPDGFHPERWCASPPPRAPYFPFGGGARRCVGEHLAHAELATVVPAFLRTARPVPLAPEPEPMVQRATVLVPRRGLLARATQPHNQGVEMNVADRKLAVVTGASSGIGFELAKVFAEEGYDLIVAAEDEELAAAARELNQVGRGVECLRVDLSRPEGVEELYAKLTADGRATDALCLNAGIGAGGEFARETDLTQELRLIDLNVRSTVHLCKLVLADMVARDAGRILFTSSVASTMPGSYQAVYNASKSFVQSFAEAIRNELKDTNVTITALMPGPTDTEFFERAEMEDTKIGAGDKDDPAEVARQGFEALMSGKEKVVAGSLMNKVQVATAGVIPDSVKAEMHRKMAEPGSDE